MKNMNNDPKCADIKYLLFKKGLNELSEDEIFSVTEHLKRCNRCRAYQRVAGEFDKVLAVPIKGGVSPDTAIHRRVQRRMMELKERREFKANGVVQFIIDILRYRIPLYQSAMGTVLIVFMSLSIHQFNLPGGYSEVKFSGVSQSMEVMVDTVDILKDILKIDSGNVERNAKEDSFLTQFIYTIM